MADPFGAVERPRACRVCQRVLAAERFLRGRGGVGRLGTCRDCTNAQKRARGPRYREHTAARYRAKYASDPAFRAREIERARRRYQQAALSRLIDGELSPSGARYRADEEYRQREVARVAAWRKAQRDKAA